MKFKKLSLMFLVSTVSIINLKTVYFESSGNPKPVFYHSETETRLLTDIWFSDDNLLNCLRKDTSAYDITKREVSNQDELRQVEGAFGLGSSHAFTIFNSKYDQRMVVVFKDLKGHEKVELRYSQKELNQDFSIIEVGEPVINVAFDPNKRYVAFETPEFIKLYDLDAKKFTDKCLDLKEFYGSKLAPKLRFMKFHPIEPTVVFCFDKEFKYVDYVYFWDFEKNDRSLILDNYKGSYLDVDFATDGTVLALNSFGYVEMMSLDKLVSKIEIGKAQNIRVSPKNNLFAVFSKNSNMFEIFDWKEKTGIYTMIVPGNVSDIAFSNDGKMMITALPESRVVIHTIHS